MSLSDFITRVLVALIVGVLIGAEREWRGRMAGIRTNALVAVGAALYVSFSMMFPEDSSPTRVGSQIVSGIGFLGGGVIIKNGFSVSGLNTAATLWCAAATGVLAGAGFVKESFIGGIIILISHIILRRLQNKVSTGSFSLQDATCDISLISSSIDIKKGRFFLENIARESDSSIKCLFSKLIKGDSIKISAQLNVKGENIDLLYDLVEKYSKHKEIDSIDIELSDFKQHNTGFGEMA
ncbi:MgtC/SapB family protein [Halonatronum saccharophilum]|uniref:MgtC/SapB family protein n=1 Tax=Halonatronum saccharophilum TaxID=150060 RepID=UPI0004BC4448|nr:MgtC/SapB family protein [Halonatronum saccharophilum]